MAGVFHRGKSNKATVNVTLHSAAEAKQAIVGWRAEKRELQVRKRELTAQEHAARAVHTDFVRSHAGMGKSLGSGLFGKSAQANARRFQAARNAKSREQLAAQLRPLEAAKASLDARMAELDRVILRAQQYIEEEKAK